MSEMSDWINQLQLQGVFTRPPNENVFYGDPVSNNGNVIADKPMFTRPPGETPNNVPPPGELPPAVLQELYGMTATGSGTAGVAPGSESGTGSLLDFMRMYGLLSGRQMPQEMYDHFGGDKILEQLRAYDPNARWATAQMGGGEGGYTDQVGRTLEFDPRLLPTSGSGIDLVNMRAVGDDRSNLRNPNMVYTDPIYGAVTHSSNIKPQQAAWWEYAAPIAVGALAPWAAGALAASGVGLGAAGATSAVTGAAAGLPWANVPGNVAAGLAGGSGAGAGNSWWSRAAGRAPRIAGQLTGGAPGTPWRPPARPPAPRAGPVGGPSSFPELYGFDPSAFNAGGSAPGARSGGDSRLVATQFAADPYGFSRG